MREVDGLREPPTDGQLETLLTELESGCFHSMTDDELFAAIRWVHKGFRAVAVTMPAGTKVFRAVRPDSGKLPETVARLSHPPEDIARKGRMNDDKESIFYGAFRNYSVCLLEMRSKSGDVFAISKWEICSSTVFNQFGYSTTPTNVNEFRREPPKGVAPAGEGDRNRMIREWQTRIVRKEVDANERDYYRITIALKRLGLSDLPKALPNGTRSFPGIMYPSVGSSLMGDNVAIPASNVERLLRFQGAELIHVSDIVIEQTETGPKPGFRYHLLDTASGQPDGSLRWASAGPAG